MNNTQQIRLSTFPRIMGELLRYAPGVHELSPGAEPELITSAETIIGLSFPPLYRTFLQCWNGMALFMGALSIFGIVRTDGLSLNEESLIEDLIEGNSERLRPLDLPAKFLIIARTAIGDRICLDAMTESGKTQTALWDHEECRLTKRWRDMRLWLWYELREGRQLYDSKGNFR